MKARIESRTLAARHRAEFEKLHPEVLRLARRKAGDAWELGRLLRRITDAALYKVAGYASFDEYVERGVRSISKRQANAYKAVCVFPKADVEELGVTLFTAILVYWAVAPGQEDPAHVRGFRFRIVVNGAWEEHVLGDRALTEKRLLDAAARMRREQAKTTSPAAAFLVRLIALLEHAMRPVAGFSVAARTRSKTAVLQLFGIPVGDLVFFWRALGRALAETDQLTARDRACVLELDESPPAPVAARAPAERGVAARGVAARGVPAGRAVAAGPSSGGAASGGAATAADDRPAPTRPPRTGAPAQRGRSPARALTSSRRPFADGAHGQLAPYGRPPRGAPARRPARRPVR